VVAVSLKKLAGVRPLASEALVDTRSRLPGEMEWLELSHVPVLDGSLSVRHEGRTQTRLTAESGMWNRWRAVFPGAHPALLVDGEPVTAESRETIGAQPESYVVVEVSPGVARTVSVPD
jgi:hypothetical protein